jgi:2-polyprenyl-3-methyl-5-hydroxy-6-metoxy-1,4-benzoquinol methylase
MAEFNVEERARLSAGQSAAVIHDAVVLALAERGIHARSLLDVGCGTGSLRARVHSLCERYVGADAIRHEGFPADAEFVLANLDSGRVALPDGTCDVVVCIETIEHVENPRALMRELVRLTMPGGWLVVTTPNQLSMLSKLTLLSKNEFVHFQERPGLYPAHISALLEIDLVRMCRENGLEDVAVRYSGRGRVPLTGRDWPNLLRARSGAKGRAFSDNVLVVGRKPITTAAPFKGD